MAGTNPDEPEIPCSGCESPVSGFAFRCARCDCEFVLHWECVLFPREVRHSAHSEHSLTLAYKPPYASGSFACDACGGTSSAFSLHCSRCDFDVHIRCAYLAPAVVHQSHPHELVLTYSPPLYDDKELRYACDLCGMDIDQKYWVYRCASCGFDAHMGCITEKGPPAVEDCPDDDSVDSLAYRLQLLEFRQKMMYEQAKAMVNCHNSIKDLIG
ncbi:hypothetical protein QJS04_geneDACA009827 [Acorus gramineus]|uniref:DC1 domain-containing protein n=1 Tax=Acorus gramineus TaxID=55184 RepID=A0AAV9BEA6_ACOGR|nr:hypothetical protein QJS04_geneDACA009827 [Acorus gramineus]